MRVSDVVLLLVSAAMVFHLSRTSSAEDLMPDLPLLKATYLGKTISSEPFGHFPDFAVGIISETLDGEKSYCTGVALTRSIVLTAGHCLTDSVGVTLQVIIDEETLVTEKVTAEDWSYHPKYNAGREGPTLRDFTRENAEDYVDLGLISLETPSEYLVPITLIPDSFDLAQNLKSWLFVLGTQRDELFRTTGEFSLSELGATEQISASQYVSDMKGNEAWCVRDSGGPVTMAAEDENGAKKHFLVGISFAFFKRMQLQNAKKLRETWGNLDKVPGCGKRVGYLDVRSQMDWIRETVDDLIPGEAARINQWVD